MSNNKIIYIGGGELGLLDEEIIKLVDKEKPNFLYIGFGNHYAESTYDVLKKIYRNHGFETNHLKKKGIIHNPNLAKERIDKADIIYLGGGDTIEFLNILKEYKIDKLLKECQNKILVGKSAGAIILSKEGFSDSKILRNESTHHEFIKGLNITNYIVSPHYEEDSVKTKELIEEVKKTKKEVICIPNDALIIVEDNKIIKCIARNTNPIVISYKGTKKLL